MSDETANVAILKHAYARWHETKAGSVDEFFSFLDDNISFGSIPRGQEPLAFATQYDGKQALRSYFDALTSEWSMIHYTIKVHAGAGYRSQLQGPAGHAGHLH